MGNDEEIIESGPNRWAGGTINAERAFLAAAREGHFKPGDSITKEWLHDALGIPTVPASMSHAEGKMLDMAFFQSCKQWKDRLLEEHNIAMETVYGVGYRWLPPEEQTSWAIKDARRSIRRNVRKLEQRIENVDVGALTPAQRAENTDALAKLGMLRAMATNAFGRTATKYLDARQDPGRKMRFDEATKTLTVILSSSYIASVDSPYPNVHFRRTVEGSIVEVEVSQVQIERGSNGLVIARADSLDVHGQGSTQLSAVRALAEEVQRYAQRMEDPKG